MTLLDASASEWASIQPDVNAEAEFLEIMYDFGDPLELIREAVSNAIDARASWIRIEFVVKRLDGRDRLVIILTDNGFTRTFRDCGVTS